MNMNKLFIATLCALLLSGAGVFAADFAVGAGTGNAAVDTPAIVAALNSALANSGPNRVVFTSGSTYVLSATLSISGDVKNVTFTTDGAGKATIVGPNYMAAPGAWDGVFTAIGLTNSSVGWDNLILLPAPFTTTGQSPFVAGSATMGIGVHPDCATDTFNIVNTVIAANNNANQAISQDGTVDPLTLTNYTMFADANINSPAPTNPGGAGHTWYLSNFVSTGVQNQPFWTGGTVDSVPGYTRGTQGDLFVAQNCVFSYSQVSAGLIADGFTVARLINCHAFNNGTDGLYLEHIIYLTMRGCTANFNSRTAAGQGIQVNSARNVVIENCYAAGHYGFDGSIGIDMGQTSGLLTEANTTFVMRNCVARDNQYGCLTRSTHLALIEDCTFTENDRCGFLERNAPTNIADCTTTMRRCTLTNNLQFTRLATTTTTDFLCALVLYAEYQVLEDVFIDGAGSADQNRGNTLFRHPLNFHARNLVTINSNQSGIWITDNPDSVTTGYGPHASALGATVENSYVGSCGLRVLSANLNGFQAPANMTVTDRAWCPILYFRGQRFWCINTVVENAISPAIAVLYERAGSNDAEAYIRDCTFINCNSQLVWLESQGDNNTQLEMDGIYSVGNAAGQIGGQRVALDINAATVTANNVNVSNQTGSVFASSFSGTTSLGRHILSGLNLSNIGPDAVIVNNAYRGTTSISNSVIRGVTAGSGISVRGGSNTTISGVEVSNAANYGISVGDPNFTPQVPMSASSLDDLLLYNNGIAGLRIMDGDGTKPPMTLTNATIVGSPEGILFDAPYGQVLQVTDTIVAGDGPGVGTGLSIPNQVAGPGVSAPPRVQIVNSALVTAGPWALAQQMSISLLNPAGTVTTSGITTVDPRFWSTTPGDPKFLWVGSNLYEGKGSGGSNLSGGAEYEWDLGIADWRRF